MEPKPRDYLKITVGKKERNYDNTKGILCK